jgi:hypothetical protein
MKFALAKATIYDAIQTRLGDALIAQEMITGYQSRGLVADQVETWKLHWMQEVERLFQTSLARVQYDAWSIGSGEDEKRVISDGYSNYTDAEAGNLCGLFKFKSSQYSNLLVGWYIGLLFLLPALWVLAAEVATIRSRYHWVTNRRCSRSNSRRNTASSEMRTQNPARPASRTDENRRTGDNLDKNDRTRWKPLVIHWLFWDLPLLIWRGICNIPSLFELMMDWCRRKTTQSRNQGIPRQNSAVNF